MAKKILIHGLRSRRAVYTHLLLFLVATEETSIVPLDLEIVLWGMKSKKIMARLLDDSQIQARVQMKYDVCCRS